MGADRRERSCPVCGWVGEMIVDVQSPYKGCKGDKARHVFGQQKREESGADDAARTGPAPR